jgi:hypothetical protein
VTRLKQRLDNRKSDGIGDFHQYLGVPCRDASDGPW